MLFGEIPQDLRREDLKTMKDLKKNRHAPRGKTREPKGSEQKGLESKGSDSGNQGEGGAGDILRKAGLRRTSQRLEIAEILFSGGNKHITAEALHRRLKGRMSLATIYNTLNQMTGAGLLQRVAVAKERIHFDTNMTDHHHFYDEKTSEIMDFPSEGVWVKGLPKAPSGKTISKVHVVIHIDGARNRG